MNIEYFLKWYAKINQNKFENSYSPHKPLTILFALSKILKGERWINYNTYQEDLENFIWSFTNKKSKPNCLQPLYRLCNDSKQYPIWTSSPTLVLNVSGDISVGDAKKHDFKAGFSEDVYQWLSIKRADIFWLIDHIIQDNFPDTLSDEILVTLEIDKETPEVLTPEMIQITTMRPKRDPNFPRLVMQAYDYRCSFCGLKIYHFNKPFPMEAAHIKWKARGGECDIHNGLSLCPTHHYTFDKGIWTVSSDYKIQISKSALFDKSTDLFFKPNEGKNILASLLDSTFTPLSENFEWHRSSIFKD